VSGSSAFPPPGLRRRLRRLRRDARGAAVVQNVVMAGLLIGMGGFAVDTAYGFRAATMLQVTVDAAALAGAMDLPDEAAAEATARAYVETNLPAGRFGDVLNAGDVVIGKWDGETRAFVPDGEAPLDAIRVDVGYGAAEGTGLPTLLLRLLGKPVFDIAASAIAIKTSDGGAMAGAVCSSGGMFSAKKVESGSDNLFRAGYCLHGEDEGVKIGSDVTFESGAVLSMVNSNDLDQGSSNRGVWEALEERSHEFMLLDEVRETVDRLFDGDQTVFPPWIYRGPYVVNKLPQNPKRGGFYIVNDVAEFKARSKWYQDLVVVAKKEVKIESDVKIRNVMLASRDKILVGSYTTVGASDYCEQGRYSVTMVAEENIEFGSNNKMRGIRMSTRKLLDLGSNNLQTAGVYAEALDMVKFGSNEDFESCAIPLTSWFDVSDQPVGGVGGAGATSVLAN